MIYFSELGQQGKLGNQLFQYAFLRATAQRLGVKFYCPSWIGDDIFLLQDSQEKGQKPAHISKKYVEPGNYTGINATAFDIQDETDINGWFQTEKYWDRDTIKRWYTFRQSKFERVTEKYLKVDFARCGGIHLRFGDKVSSIGSRATYYVAPPQFYSRAISLMSNSRQIVVFTDEVEEAKNFLKPLKIDFLYIEGNEGWEDLYLMTLCHDFAISTSTISWWGAFLNQFPDAKIMAPAEGSYRTGCYIRNQDYLCPEWIKIKTLKWYSGHYRIVLYGECIKHPLEAMGLVRQKFFKFWHSGKISPGQSD
jgi:hypothetical protein